MSNGSFFCFGICGAVEAAPAKVKEGIGKEEAESIKAKLTEAGATVDIE